MLFAASRISMRQTAIPSAAVVVEMENVDEAQVRVGETKKVAVPLSRRAKSHVPSMAPITE